MAVDLRHEHEPAGGREQPKGVARGNDFVGSRVFCREVLDPLGVEPRTQPLDCAFDLRPVAAGDEIDGLEVFDGTHISARWRR